MAETTDDVRRDIELTRERMSSTLAELEHKLNVMEMVKANPWPAIALAVALFIATQFTNMESWRVKDPKTPLLLLANPALFVISWFGLALLGF